MLGDDSWVIAFPRRSPNAKTRGGVLAAMPEVAGADVPLAPRAVGAGDGPRKIGSEAGDRGGDAGRHGGCVGGTDGAKRRDLPTFSEPDRSKGCTASYRRCADSGGQGDAFSDGCEIGSVAACAAERARESAVSR